MVNILFQTISIFDGCFRSCEVSKITLHEQISNIGTWAFAQTGITSIKIPELVTSVKISCFAHCISLQYVNLSNKTTTIEYMAFYNCPNLLEMKIPETLTSVSTAVFFNCMKLKLDVSDNKHINYVDNMLFTNERKSLSDYFGDDPNTDLVIPDGLNLVGYSTFNAKKLRSISFNGASLIQIDRLAFYKCTLEKITLPSSLNSIGDQCFQGCPNLKTVEFPNNEVLTIIPKNCFSGCTQLRNIILPSSITTIRERAFGDCTNIGDIGLSGTQIQNIDIFAFVNSGITSCDNGKNLLTFNYGAFMNSKIQSLTVSTSSIPENCFYNCIYLTSITFNNNIASIEASAFEKCVSLREFVIPNSVTVIKSFAFRNCISLNKVSLSLNSVLSEIYGGTFINCPQLVLSLIHI